MAESKQILNRRVSIRGTNTVDPVIGEGGGDSGSSDYIRVISDHPVNGVFNHDLSQYDTDDVVIYLSSAAQNAGATPGKVTLSVNGSVFAHLNSGVDRVINTIGARIEKRGGRVFAQASVLKTSNNEYDGSLYAEPVGIYGTAATKISTVSVSATTQKGTGASIPFEAGSTINIYVRASSPVTPV